VRYIEEDVYRPAVLLRRYGACVIVLTLLVLITGAIGEYIAGSLLCAASSPLMLHCSYWVSPQNARVKRRFRLYLALITGGACCILFSYSGVDVRTMRLPDGIVFGVCAAVAAYVLAMVTDFVASAVFGRVRAFLAEGLCSVCGYDLRGNVSGTCPECGTVIPNARDIPHQPRADK
jgi:hypothetical protein